MIAKRHTTDVKLRVFGKFIYLKGEKLYIKGVSYGWFPPEENDGIPYPRPEVVRKDFEMMKIAGINTIRTSDPPPEYVLDLADEADIKVIDTQLGDELDVYRLSADAPESRQATINGVRASEDGTVEPPQPEKMKTAGKDTIRVQLPPCSVMLLVATVS